MQLSRLWAAELRTLGTSEWALLTLWTSHYRRKDQHVQASNLAQAGDAFFALTHSMNMHGRAAAMVTPIGDKKKLLPAESAVSSSGCAGRGRLKSGSSRKKKWKHARLQGAQRREGVCVGLGCRGPECDFACFLDSRPRDLGTVGDGAPPQAHIHLNLEVDYSLGVIPN
jgi:hypothetical protein